MTPVVVYKYIAGMFQRVLLGCVLGICVLASSGCGGQLYNVTTRPSSLPPGNVTSNAEGFSVGAVALDSDQSLERFEANLPLAGVIAVDVVVKNQTATAINTGNLRFDLRANNGKVLKSLLPKTALKRVMKYYGNSFYRVDARQRTIESYEAIALSTSLALSPGDERRGLLFFEIAQNTAQLAGMTLSVSGTGIKNVPLNIKLN